MILTALLVAVAMTAEDMLGTCTTVFIARGRALIASLFDVAGDIAAVLTLGVGAVNVVQHGVSVFAAAILAAMAIGSVLGTVGGVRLSKLLERRFGVPIPHNRPIRRTF